MVLDFSSYLPYPRSHMKVTGNGSENLPCHDRQILQYSYFRVVGSVQIDNTIYFHALDMLEVDLCIRTILERGVRSFWGR